MMDSLDQSGQERDALMDRSEPGAEQIDCLIQRRTQSAVEAILTECFNQTEGYSLAEDPEIIALR